MPSRLERVSSRRLPTWNRRTAVPRTARRCALARVELARTDHRIADFRDDAGTEVQHPAAVATVRVDRLRKNGALQTRVAALASPCQEVLEPLVSAVAQRVCGDLGRVADAEYGAEYADVEQQLRRAEADPECAPAGGMPFEGAEREAVQPTLVEPGPSWAPGNLVGNLLAAVGVTGVLVLATVVLMFATVAMSTWAAKPVFGTSADYWSLFAAALASSAAAAVVSLLAVWRSDGAEDA